ncbi:MAG TPA: DUF402 domain-containing protein [Candidatus Limnocylindria bacterium]|nr:DUF402 domain-containing protein [Candidatus Limnocylindria bacterium]
MDGHASGSSVRWDGRKWPNRLHWQFEMTWLGEDEYGVWLAVASGTVVRRGHEPPRHLPDGFVSLVPPGEWWEAEFYVSHPELQIYVNIGTACEWRKGSVRQVDLDLDVVRTHDGEVRTLDEDEFIDHQARFAYPPDLIVGARRAADSVVTMLERHQEPFNQASQRWLDYADEVLAPNGRLGRR